MEEERFGKLGRTDYVQLVRLLCVNSSDYTMECESILYDVLTNGPQKKEVPLFTFNNHFRVTFDIDNSENKDTPILGFKLYLDDNVVVKTNYHTFADDLELFDDFDDPSMLIHFNPYNRFIGEIVFKYLSDLELVLLPSEHCLNFGEILILGKKKAADKLSKWLGVSHFGSSTTITLAQGVKIKIESLVEDDNYHLNNEENIAVISYYLETDNNIDYIVGSCKFLLNKETDSGSIRRYSDEAYLDMIGNLLTCFYL